jgi:hypothetical protein
VIDARPLRDKAAELRVSRLELQEHDLVFGHED